MLLNSFHRGSFDINPIILKHCERFHEKYLVLLIEF